MLVTQDVKVNLHNRNKKHFCSLGYTAIEGIFTVKVSDLMRQSKAQVEVQCDYCKKNKIINYYDYIKCKNKYISKDACADCTHLKREEILLFRLENNLMSDKEVRGFYKNKDFVLRDLKTYIEDNNHIGAKEDDIITWRRVKRGIENIGMNIQQACAEVGYNSDELQLRVPNGYYDDFELVKKEIERFIKINNRFPSQPEFSKEMGSIPYFKHGTFQEIKKRMGYYDKEDLVDLTGFINKSRYELVTANFLTMIGVKYRREQFPFKKYNSKNKYRSDFTFYLDDGNEIHCEIWGGYKKSQNSKKFIGYKEKMDIKLELYKKHNISLISIFPDTFNYSAIGVKRNLEEIFSPYMSANFRDVDNSLLSNIRLKHMTDDDLFKEIMLHSDNTTTLPSSGTLRKLSKEFLYVEVLKRFDSYYDFAEKFKVKTKRSINRNIRNSLGTSTG